MAAGYTRQASANIAPALPINAEDFNLEFNAIQTAFDNALGHDHSGTATGTGAKINLNTATQGILPKVNGGTGVDGSLVGITFPSGTFNGLVSCTTLTASGAVTLSSSLSVGTTLGVTGNTTLSGTLGVTGDTTVVNLIASGTTTTAAITASGIINSTSQVQDNGSRVFSPNNLLGIVSSTPANPTGTTSATGKMMGLAAAFTPTKSTQALVIIQGVNLTNTADIADVILRWGTGTAPINGAAPTGTQLGNSFRMAALHPFTIVGKITGLTLNTAIWADIELISEDGITQAIIQNLTAIILEV